MQPAAGGDGAAAADSAGGAPDEAELLSLRFGLPTHARVGHLWFQRRAVLVAEAAQSLDAATYIEALVVQNRGSGLMCAVHGRAWCGKSALVSTVVSRLQVPGGGYVTREAVERRRPERRLGRRCRGSCVGGGPQADRFAPDFSRSEPLLERSARRRRRREASRAADKRARDPARPLGGRSVRSLSDLRAASDVGNYRPPQASSTNRVTATGHHDLNRNQQLHAGSKKKIID